MDRIFLVAVATLATGMTLIPLGDTFGKLLVGSGVHPFFVGWSRFTIGALILLPFTSLALVVGLLRDWRIWLRGVLIVGGVFSILTALGTQPIANVFGAFFVGPMVSYVLSVWLLKETVSLARTVLLLLGFVGVMLVIQPGGDFDVGILWAILAGFFYGAFLTASRWVSGLGRPIELLAASLAAGAILTLPLGAITVPDMDPVRAGLTLGSALASMLGNLLLLRAYRHAPASTLAPFIYTQLIAATFLGVLVFGNWPNAVALFGLVLIVFSGFATLALKTNARPPGSP